MQGVWTAFPPADYYGDSAPSYDPQPTAGLPATGLADRRKGRSQDGSHCDDEGGGCGEGLTQSTTGLVPIA
jgi:hypothetical protein